MVCAHIKMPRITPAVSFPSQRQLRFRPSSERGNLHKPDEIGIDSFQADRAPDHTYKTQNLAAVFIRERGLFMRAANKGRFYHDVLRRFWMLSITTTFSSSSD